MPVTRSLSVFSNMVLALDERTRSAWSVSSAPTMCYHGVITVLYTSWYCVLYHTAWYGIVIYCNTLSN